MSIATLIQSETQAITQRLEVLEVEYDHATTDDERAVIEAEAIVLSDALMDLDEMV